MANLRAGAAAILFCCFATPLLGHAASFDCSKATSRVEVLICAESELSKLDDDLMAAYGAASAVPDSAEQVRRDQRQWLNVRNACGDSTCIKSAYVGRLSDFSSVQTATSPDQTPLREILSSLFKGADTPSRIDSDHVIFSQYDQSGNSKNIISVNIRDGSTRKIVDGVNDGVFVAEDDRFLVYSVRGTNANPLIVSDKRSNKRVASVRLLSPILWGDIAGDRLLIAQAGTMGKATILVYSLPGLKLQRSTDITGGSKIASWGEKIVSLGYQLSIHDRDFNEIAVMNIPKGDPSLGANCEPGPLLVSGDKAVIGANCRQLAVVDLPTARIERLIPTESNFQSFAIIEGLLFTVDPDGGAPDVRVIELSTGRELARLRIAATYLAAGGKSLLAMTKRQWLDPLKFTLYEVKLSGLRSETSRSARTLNGCRAAEKRLNGNNDVHAAILSCESAGILGYASSTNLPTDLRDALKEYARWLTMSLSRYSEGLAILEKLQNISPNLSLATQIVLTKRKADLLNAPNNDARASQVPDKTGVTRTSVDFGSFTDLMLFDSDRLYVARWDCGTHGSAGVTLDALDRKSLHAIKRVVIANCDDSQQDSITTIGTVPGYIVLGLGYRYEEANRPTVAVVNARTLELVKKSFVQRPIDTLSQWRGKLLACSDKLDQPHSRFDPVSARYVAVPDEEARACANGDPVPLPLGEIKKGVALAETPHYRIYENNEASVKSFRLTNKESNTSTVMPVSQNAYFEFAIPTRDAFLLRHRDSKYTRFVRYDIAAKTETVLFELSPQRRDVSSTVWGQILLVAIGRDLLTYDLERRLVIDYEKEFIREGFLSNCCGLDRNGIRRLLLDGNRLIVLTFDGSNSRVIDLNTYTAGLPRRDFFFTSDKG